jgi:hypothetical protein
MIALISETLNNRKIVGDVDKSDIVNIGLENFCGKSSRFGSIRN